MTMTVMTDEFDTDMEIESEASDAGAAEEIFQQLRLMEGLIFSADVPVTIAKLQTALNSQFGEGVDAMTLTARLQQEYMGRGIELVSVAGGYAFRTAPDLTAAMKGEKPAESRKPPRAATETLAIVAYHQPVTRAEIEAIRGVQVSRGTLDILMEAGWVRPGKRRETPGRPVTWLTTTQFLEHFGLSSLRDLPGIEELKASGLLDAKPVLATLPAEGDFSAAEDETREDNDFLPAGDETTDERSEDEWEAQFTAEDESDQVSDENDAPHRLAAAAE